MNRGLVKALAACACLVGFPAAAGDALGEIVSAKGNELIQPAGAGDWQPVSVGQTVGAGDLIRTGPYGGLSLVLRDETQIRLHAASLLRIEAVPAAGAEGETSLQLLAGSAWSRAKSRPPSALKLEQKPRAVQVRTHTATIGIRGTDWHVRAEPNRTTLAVLSGAAEMENELGSVAVLGGEVGVAEKGQAPSKRLVVDLRDRPLIVLDIELEWLDMLSLTGERPATLQARRDGGDRLDQAEIAYDLGEFARVSALLEGVAPDSQRDAGRVALLRAMLELRMREYAAAEPLFRRAQGKLSGRSAVVAALGEVGALIGQQDYADADAKLKRLEQQAAAYPEVALFRVWLVSFAGDHEPAIELAQAAQARFPRDARFSALLAHLYFVTDRREAMAAAIEEALRLDAEEVFGWQVQGLFHHYVEPDPEAALTAYGRAVAIKPAYAPAWNGLGVVYFDLGDYDAAEAAMQRALAADPASTRIRSNYGFMQVVLHRMGEAQRLFDEVLARQPDEPYGLLGLGYVDMLRGRPEEGVQKILKVTTINPQLPQGSTSLAAAYYQSGRYAAAKQELDAARRADPDDPIPDVLGSVMAVDHYRAGEAIHLARDGFEKTLKAESFAVENLANSKSGSSTLGFAFSNLGLHEWGGYYTELAFDPYLAGGYFYLSDREQFDSERTRLGASRQGLLLDPLAVSSPPRWYEPFRQPRFDTTLFGIVARGDDAPAHLGSALFQGHTGGEQPSSYFLYLADGHDDGIRENSEAGDRAVFAGAGSTWGGKRHNLLVLLDHHQFDFERPRLTSDPDINDKDEDEFTFLTLGYQLRLDYDNRLMFGFQTGEERQNFHSNEESATGLSDRDVSLLAFFGFTPDALPRLRRLYRDGLFDVTPAYGGDANNPDLVFGPLGPGFGVPRLVDQIPADVDLDSVIDNELRDEKYALQFRHLLNLGAVEFSYGAEAVSIEQEQTLQQLLFAFTFRGVICLTDLPPPNCRFNPLFFGVDITAPESEFDNSTTAYQTYAQARWKMTPSFWTEAGLFYRSLKTEFGAPVFDEFETDKQKWDPRLGFAWRVTPQHWLRLALQQELFFPQRSAETLAPVATVGLVLPETAFTFFEGGPDARDLQLRWDAEWLPWLFTFAGLERQVIRDFIIPSEDGFGTRYEQGRIDALTLGANLWLLDNLGFSASYTRRDTENESDDLFDGEELVRVPQSLASLGLTWVDRRQFRVGLGAEYQGRRWNEPANTSRLDSFWLGSAFVTWEPGLKHWQLTLGANNIADKDYETELGFPARGRQSFFSTEYRF